MKADFLDEMINERQRAVPDFRRRVDEAAVRRRLARELASRRERHGLSQTVVAGRMGTSQSIVSRLEQGADVRLSTLQRYCSAIGEQLAAVLKASAQTSAPRGGSARTG